MATPLTVSVGGLGAIGVPVARALAAGIHGLELVAVSARDRDKARIYYLSAQGERAHKTFFWVAEQFDRGADLVPVDHSEALAWYAAAAEMGDQRAQQVLARAFRED